MKTYVRLLFLPLFGLAAAACGGGGGGGGSGRSVAPVGAALLPDYDFSLSDAGDERNRLVATATFGGPAPIDVTIDFRIEPAVGRYEYASRTVVFEDGAIAVEGDYGPMVVDIVEPVTLAPGAIPDGVTVEVSAAFFQGVVSVTFSGGMVELAQAGASPVSMPFNEFEDLILSQTFIPVWQRQSSLAWAALDLLRQLVTASADSFALIGSDLESSIAVERFCDAFPGSPPPGAQVQGLSRLTWLGSGQIRNGDRFAWEFTSCWLDSPTGRDVLLDGRVDLNGYSATASGGSITRIGYDAAVTGVVPGLDFMGLGVSRTVESPAGVFQYASGQSFTLGNGLRVTFSAPE